MNTQKTVIELARENHKQHWRRTSNVSKQTKSSTKVCMAWQKAVKEEFPGRFKEECVIGSNCNEKIDLVDKKALVAYELKVSPNNTHFEFYRDIFKVWVQRELPGDKLRKLKKLVFITPESGAQRLRKNFAIQVTRLARRHALKVEVAAI